MNDSDTFLRVILAAYPSLKPMSSNLVAKSGQDYTVIILDGKIAFRFPKETGSPTANLATEIKLLEKLNPLVNTNIPNYVYRGKDYSFGGYNLIHGNPLDTSNISNNLRNEETTSTVAKFLTVLHNFNIPSAKKIGIIDTLGYDIIKKDYMNKLHFICASLSEQEINFIKIALEELKRSKYKQNCLIHGDLSAAHILVEKNKISGIIDFGDAEIGDPSKDFAIFWDFGKEFIKNMYHRYQGPKDCNLLRRAQINNLRLHISNIYWNSKIGRKDLNDHSLKAIKKLVKRGFYSF